MSVAILDETMCVHLLCTLWSGTVRLTREDLGEEGKALPPSHVATAGSLKVINPKVITGLGSHKKRGQRFLQGRCVRFLSSYAGDANMSREIVEGLEEVKAEFDAEAADIVAALPGHYDRWASENPEQADLISRRQPTVDYVSARLGFDYQIYQIGAVRTEDGTIDEDAPENRGLIKQAEGLSGQLYREIEKAARDAREKTFGGKEAVGQKALGPIRAIREKLNSLRYLDASVGGLVQHIDNVLASVARSGKLQGNDLLALFGLLDVLCDSNRMKVTGVIPVFATPVWTPPTVEIVLDTDVDPQSSDSDDEETAATEVAASESEEDDEQETVTEGDSPEPTTPASGGFFSF